MTEKRKKINISDFLKARFLTDDNKAMKNWFFILYISSLAFIMIAMSHSVDNKVFKISELNENIKKLNSEFVENRAKLQQKTLKSNLLEKMKNHGFTFDRRRVKNITVKKVE